MMGIQNTQIDDLLTHDHSEIDALVDKIVSLFSSGEPEPIYEAIDLFWARLAIHIRAEHLHLFPKLTESAGALDEAEADELRSLIGKLHDDHNTFMRELIEAIKTMRRMIAEPDMDRQLAMDRVKDTVESVRSRLALHNEKEETNIYPLVDRLLSPAAAAALRKQMKRELKNLPPRFTRM